VPGLHRDRDAGGVITPEEVADVVLWLCSSAGASVTGQAISVSGGET
jgi:3-hydroxybutyrate dehydrogenase